MSQEFSTLCDLVLARGISHSELLKRIKSEVLLEFSKLYPQKTADLDVLVDTQNGKVRLLRLNKDVTPLEFVQTAEEVARGVLVDVLASCETPNQKPSLQSHDYNLGGFFVQSIFWGYNLVYLFLVLILVIGMLNSSSYTDKPWWTLFGQMGVFKSLLAVMMGLIPVFTIGYVIKTKIWKDTSQLFRTFFTLEIPLILATFIPFNIFNNPIAPVTLCICILILTPIVFAISRKIPIQIGERSQVLLLISQQFIAQSWIYLLVLFAFFIPLILGGYAKVVLDPLLSSIRPPVYYEGYGSLDYYRPRSMSFLGLILLGTLGIVGFLGIATVITLPFLLTLDLGKLWYKSRQALLQRISREKLLSIHVVTLAIWVLVLLAVSYQPSQDALVRKLLSFAKATNFETKKDLAKDINTHEVRLKQALIDMADARGRYPFTLDDDSLPQAYRSVFNLDNDTGITHYIQASFLSIASPFVYRGEQGLANDTQQAYQTFFGHSIYEEEYKREAAKDVHLESRTISGKSSSDGMLATISVDEQYKSTSRQQEEVIYEFSLPEDAVITDLKLGPNLEFDGVVAPRGAAQRTFEQQMVQKRDPALLEQTGPRQYRLRVFPIPAKDDKVTLNGKNQRVQYSYVVALSEDGFGLPVYSEKQNVFEDIQTKIRVTFDERTINLSSNDQFIRSTKQLDLCSGAPASQLTFSVGQDSYTFVPYASVPQLKVQLPCSLTSGTDLFPINQSNIAILFDVSYQNKDSAIVGDIKQLLRKNPQFFSANKVDWYEYSDDLSQAKQLVTETDLDSESISYFGSSKPLKVLSDVSRRYDLVVLITSDTESFSNMDIDYQSLSMPIAIVHTKVLPAYRNEFTASLLQQRGGVFTNVRSALIRYALERQLQASSTQKFISYGSYWALAQTRQSIIQPTQSAFGTLINEAGNWGVSTYDPDNPLASLGSAKYLRYKLTQYQGNLMSNLSFLDAANTFAKSAHIVSPYSSMIALVNQQQMEELRRNSQESTRYEEGTTAEITRGIRNPVTIGIDSPNAGVTDFGSNMGKILNPLGSVNSFKMQIPSSGYEGNSSGFMIGGSPDATGYGSKGVGFGGSLLSGRSALLSLFIIANVLLVGTSLLVFGIKRIVKRKK